MGVGFLSATLAITSAAKKGVGDALVAQYSKADVIVRPAGMGVRPDDVPTITDLTGVAHSTLSDQAWFTTNWPGRRGTLRSRGRRDRRRQGACGGSIWRRARFPSSPTRSSSTQMSRPSMGSSAGDKVGLRTSGGRPASYTRRRLDRAGEGADLRADACSSWIGRASTGVSTGRRRSCSCSARDGVSADELGCRGRGPRSRCARDDDGRGAAHGDEFAHRRRRSDRADAEGVRRCRDVRRGARSSPTRSRSWSPSAPETSRLLRCVGGSRRQVLGSVVARQRCSVWSTASSVRLPASARLRCSSSCSTPPRCRCR